MPLRYDELATGDGGTVVLLHSLALDATIWPEFAARVGGNLRVLAPDLPGHGRDPQGDPSSVESMADAVVSLLDSLDTGPVILIGMSLGGSVAQAVAIRHSRLVSRLGLIDTTAWYGPDAPAAWGARAEQAQQRGLASLAGFQLERWFTDAFRERCPELGGRLLEVFQRNDVADYTSSCRALGAMDLRDGLAGIGVPTSIVVGELDGATPPSHAERLAAGISGSVLVVLPGCKHLSALERPDAVAAALAPILATVAA